MLALMLMKYRMKTLTVLSLSIAANVAGNLFLVKGIKTLGDFPLRLEAWPQFLAQALANPMVLAGVAFLILFYLLFVASLSWADLSFVLPILSASYVVNALAARYLLGESVPVLRWAGITLVSLGVYLVSATAATSKTE
jgi:drug/metabolite transporter (DMT)-like permease